MTGPNCGVFFEAEDGTRLSDTSLKLWDIEIDGETSYCIRHTEETNPIANLCGVEFTTEFFKRQAIRIDFENFNIYLTFESLTPLWLFCKLRVVKVKK